MLNISAARPILNRENLENIENIKISLNQTTVLHQLL